MNRLASLGLSNLSHAILLQKHYTYIPYSKLLKQILEIFLRYNLISLYMLVPNLKKVQTKAYKVFFHQPGIILALKFIPTPGKRVYCNLKQLLLFQLKAEFETIIISTNKGCLPLIEAIKFKTGGEVLLGISLVPRKYSKSYHAHLKT
jgi:ribosomal protein S8